MDRGTSVILEYFMNKIIKSLVITMVTICFLTVLKIPAFAADKDTVIALGEDLTAEQRATVLALMDVSEEELKECRVIYVSNSEEHKYLDQYIGSDIIGTHALTSVKMTKAAKGSGITVTTQNVNYCTTGMYRNALLTAGVEDRDVFVVAPMPVSGTAGLIGAIKAYEVSSGENISANTIDTALDEMITTGEISTQLESVSSEDVEALIAWLKNMIATGQLDTSDENSIRDTIDKGEKEFGVTLNKEEEKKIINLLKKMDKMGLNGSYLISQAENLYEKYGMDVVNQASEVLGEAIDNAVEQASKSFFDSIKESFKKSVSDLFGNFKK